MIYPSFPRFFVLKMFVALLATGALSVNSFANAGEEPAWRPIEKSHDRPSGFSCSTAGYGAMATARCLQLVACDTTWSTAIEVQGIGRVGAMPFGWSGGEGLWSKTQLEFAGAYMTVQYLSEGNGVRQNFLVPERLTGAGPLVIGLSITGDLTPLLIGADHLSFGDAHGAVKLKYADLRCWDANGTPLAAHLELDKASTAASLQIVVDDRSACYPIVVDPISTVPNTTLVGTFAAGEFGYPPNTAGDLNGDGYSDLVVGARQASNPELQEGVAYVYYGSVTGIPTVPSVILQVNQATATFGCSVSTAGDVNGDGYSDLIIGAQNWEDNAGTAQEGAAFIYYGSATGITTVPNLTLQTNKAADYFGANVATAGDINNDGFSDVIIGGFLAEYPTYQEGAVWVYMGSVAGLNPVPLHRLEANIGAAHFGRSLSPAGDVNGDGFSDIIIGAPDAPNVNVDAGKAYIYHGSAAGFGAGLNPAPAATLLGSTVPNGSFGWSVSAAGDVNGDGYSDVVVGAYLDNNGQATEGTAWVFHGSAAGVSTTVATFLESNIAGVWFGRSVSTAGDINGDGFGDVMVGAPLLANGQSSEGVARLYLGSATGISTTVSIQWELNSTGANFGDGMACVGDVNGDGYSDVSIGAKLYGITGAAVVFHGGPVGTATAFAMSRFGGVTSARLGASAGNAGDLNGDGYTDALFGAPGVNAAYVHYGSATGIAVAPSLTLTGTAGTQFGTSVASAGDVNGDGYADVVVGAPLSGAGAAYIYMGSPGGLVAAPALTLTGGSLFGTSVAPAGDVNTDGYADVIVGAPGSGQAFVYHGSFSGLNATPVITLTVAPSSNLFGCAVHTAGDVNGDGYSDVVIGARAGANGQALEGLAFVYLGSTTGIVTPFQRQLEANVVGANFGVSVAGAGDVNGDGFSEVIIGADLWESSVAEANEGAAFMFNGTSTGTVAVASNTLQRNIAGGAMGRSVAEAGDVNGDGYADVVVGSALAESVELDEGLAYVFRGGPTGNSSAVVDILQPNVAGFQFGSAVSGGGDLDGDGYSDVLIGASNAAPSLAGEGGAYWFRGNNARSLGRITRQYDADLVTPLSTNGMDFSQPDYFGIGHRARSPIHRCRTKLKWEVVFEGQPFSGAPITNSLLSTGTSAAWTTLPLAGVEIKQLIYKVSGMLRYKWRVRVEYDMAKLITGQRFSRWFYGYANSVGDIGVLPIELVEFTGWPEAQENVLHWTTATEDNSERFDVYRSRNGIDQELIGALPAAGASQSMLSYLFNDPNPPPGTVYYQLNMVDRDGESERSPLIAVTRVSNVVLYPDPADDAVTLSAAALYGVLRVIVVDGLGRAVLDQHMHSTGPATQLILPLNGLASGRYTVQLMDAQGGLLDRLPFIKR